MPIKKKANRTSGNGHVCVPQVPYCIIGASCPGCYDLWLSKQDKPVAKKVSKK